MTLTDNELYARIIDDWYDGLNDAHDHTITHLVYGYLEAITEYE